MILIDISLQGRARGRSQARVLKMWVQSDGPADIPYSTDLRRDALCHLLSLQWKTFDKKTVELMNERKLYIKTYRIFIPKPLLLCNQSADSPPHTGIMIQNPAHLIGSGTVAREKQTQRQETTKQHGNGVHGSQPLQVLHPPALNRWLLGGNKKKAAKTQTERAKGAHVAGKMARWCLQSAPTGLSASHGGLLFALSNVTRNVLIVSILICHFIQFKV